jgi:hypothetical protein
MSEIDDQAQEHAKGRTWISPDIFDANLRPPGWKDDPELRAGVDWLMSFVPAGSLMTAIASLGISSSARRFLTTR